MNAFQSKVCNIDVQPEVFYLAFNINNVPIEPEPYFVISKSKDGKVLSEYKDDVWDLEPYKTTVTGNSKIYFKKWYEDDSEIKTLIVKELKWLMFFLIYIATPLGRNGASKSVGSLVSNATVLISISKLCVKENLSLIHALESEKWIKNNLDSISIKSNSLLPSFLAAIVSAGFNKCKVKPLSSKFIKSILDKNSNKISNQTVVIPTRIYSAILQDLDDFILEFVEHKEAIFKLIKKVHKNPLYARGTTGQRVRIKKLNLSIDEVTIQPDFISAAKKLSLNELFSKHNVDALHKLSRYLTLVQYKCKLKIHAYTGMRSNEAYSLNYNCIDNDVLLDSNMVYISGETTKLTGTRKVTRWLMPKEAVNAINVCKDIIKLISSYKGFDSNEMPLFCSIAHLGWASCKKIENPKAVNHFNNVVLHAHLLSSFIKLIWF